MTTTKKKIAVTHYDSSVGLHSHSGIEREMGFPKDIVLVDEKYRDMFDGEPCKEYVYKNVKYLMVNIYSFFRKGGVFQNRYK